MLRSLNCRRLSTFSLHRRHKELASVIREVEILGEQAQLRAIFNLVDSFPVHTIVNAAVHDSKQRRNPEPTYRFDFKAATKPTAFSYIFNAFLLMKSGKVKAMIKYMKTDMMLADTIGSRALYDACDLIRKIESAARKAIENNQEVQIHEPFTNERLHSFKNLHSTENIFVAHYTHWLLNMSAAQRFHHTLKLMSYSNINRRSYYANQLQYLHDELSFLGNTEKRNTDRRSYNANELQHLDDDISLLRNSEKGSTDKGNTELDYTVLGDVALSCFTALEMCTTPEIAIGMIKHPLINVSNISEAALSLAVTGCIPRKSDKKRNFMPESLKHLMSLCDGNSFQCINLRNVLFQVNCSILN